LVKLQIHQGQRFLHVLDVRGGVVQMAFSQSQVRAQLCDVPRYRSCWQRLAAIAPVLGDPVGNALRR
jgi:hypothetical protein